MSFDLLISKVAREETEVPAFYYEDIYPGLGAAFLQELERFYTAIAENPHFYGFIDSKKLLRDVALKKYPFVVIFKVEGKKVVVLSVHNTNRKPKFK
jgi:hypothetical protein